jgi:acyl carrier protein
MTEDVKDRIKKVLVLNVLKDMSAQDIENDTSLIDLGVGLDSVTTLELVVALEEEFQVTVDEGDITPEILQTVDSIAAYLAGKS